MKLPQLTTAVGTLVEGDLEAVQREDLSRAILLTFFFYCDLEI